MIDSLTKMYWAFYLEAIRKAISGQASWDAPEKVMEEGRDMVEYFSWNYSAPICYRHLQAYDRETMDIETTLIRTCLLGWH